MGGSAFTTGPNPLFTPRMPPAIYSAAKQRCIDLLLMHFHHVASPVEGPDKEDHGDVDILMCESRDESHLSEVNPRDQIEAVATLLGAVRSIIPGGAEVAANFAIPWNPESNSELESESRSHSTQHDLQRKRDEPLKFIQVDVRVCESHKVYAWMLFKHGHGDLWNFLGSMIRPYGLTVNDSGMYIRVPEIERTDKNRAKVLLTSDPATVLTFLELPVGKVLTEPFSSLADMFAYVSQCRMMYVPATDDEGESRREATGSAFIGERKSLTSNDRRRLKFRPAFRQWIEDFIPQCRARGLFQEQKTTRAQVTDEALDRFDVRAEYARTRHNFLIERQRDMIWNDAIKSSIAPAEPGDQRSILYRSCLVKALKRVILERDESYDVVAGPEMTGKDGFYDMDAVRVFIARHKDEVGRAAMRKHNATCAERISRKIP